jgi:hypothetical protein
MDSVYPKDRYFGALENGLYTFTLPDSGAEQYRDTLQGPTRSLIAPTWAGVPATAAVFDLDKLAYANVIAFNDIGGDATTLAITVDRHIEFRSSSVLFPLGFSTLPLETYHAAQMALVQMGVFFENPTHLGMIASIVASAVRSVASYAAPIAREVGKAALTAAGDKLVNMATRRLGEMNQSKMVKNKDKQQIKTITRRKKVKVAKRR